jgi:hypothetical protein
MACVACTRSIQFNACIPMSKMCAVMKKILFAPCFNIQELFSSQYSIPAHKRIAISLLADICCHGGKSYK